MQRIIVVGTSGSGKTTLAKELATQLGLTHQELDAINWQPGWQQASTDQFRSMLAAFTAQPRWVVDGNYGKGRNLLWPKADTIVWLDYALPIILWRLLGRTLRRTLTKEELWNGNRERFRAQFFTNDSILLWALKTYRRRRTEIPRLLAEPEHSHLELIHLRSPKETARWLKSVKKGGTA